MNFNKVLKEKIESLLSDIKTTHIYKSSIIYSLYNDAYQRNDKVSTCGSCLRTRVQLLEKWLNCYKEPAMKIKDVIQEPIENKLVMETEEPIEKRKRKPKE